MYKDIFMFTEYVLLYSLSKTIVILRAIDTYRAETFSNFPNIMESHEICMIIQIPVYLHLLSVIPSIYYGNLC